MSGDFVEVPVTNVRPIPGSRPSRPEGRDATIFEDIGSEETKKSIAVKSFRFPLPKAQSVCS